MACDQLRQCGFRCNATHFGALSILNYAIVRHSTRSLESLHFEYNGKKKRVREFELIGIEYFFRLCRAIEVEKQTR